MTSIALTLGLFICFLILNFIYKLFRPYYIMLKWKKQYGDKVEYYFHPINGSKHKPKESLEKFNDDHYWVVDIVNRNPNVQLIISNYMGKVMIILLNPDLIREQAQNQRFYERRGLEQVWLSHKLLTLSLFGDISFDKWKKQKAILSPVFHFDNLKSKVEIIKEVTAKEVEKYKKLYTVNDGNIKWDLENELKDITGEVVVKSFFGKEYNGTIKDPNGAKELSISEYFVNTMQQLTVYSMSMKHLMKRTFLGKYISDKFFLSQEQKQMIKKVEVMRQVLDNIVEEKINSFDPNKTNIDLSEIYISAFLNQKQGEQYPITKEEIVHQFIAFHITGAGTTANLASKLIYFLGLYPEVKAKVEKEISDVFASTDDINFENLKKLVYVQAYMKEVLRYFGTVSKSMMRESMKRQQIGGFTIEKGWIVQSFIHQMMRSHHYFPEPDDFRPERFLEKYTDIQKVYTPFHQGSQNCIGQHLAEMEAKIILIYFVKNFEISCPYKSHADIKIIQSTTYRSIDPYLCQIKLKK
uniref:Cytochrome P450 family monooxygenase n=1 Tax=Philasterides dicentrarchi TaxID=282688 RepID=A0A411KVC1_9CILI|nr:cytochrome P450 family monooxygenase [Philasterides dicentrarchi]